MKILCFVCDQVTFAFFSPSDILLVKNVFILLKKNQKQTNCVGCPHINFTFLNVNNVRTNIRIATPVVQLY